MASTSSGTGNGSDTATPSPSPTRARTRTNGGLTDPKANISSLPASSFNHLPVDMGDTTNEEETATEDIDDNVRRPEHVEWLDEIRFASYRTAAKLRLLQKRTGLVHIDIWNMIEAFRENGLNRIDSEVLVQRPKIETLVGSLYSSLAKRLPLPQNGSNAESGASTVNTVNQQVETMASWLLSWLVAALAKTATAPSSSVNLNYGDNDGSLKVRTLKMALAVLCSGKLMDKLRYIFSLLADNNGHLIHDKYASFVRDVSCVPQAVGEQISRGSQPSASPSPFEEGSKVTVNDFLEALMSDPGPQCILWLPVLHRMATAENSVHHGISCGSCGDKEFRGLRYKSDRSGKYNLCQWCFWRGRIPPEHRDDVFKEYNSFKTPGNSDSKNSSRFQCGGKGQKSNLPKYPEVETPLDLSNMIPPSPLPSIRSNGAVTLKEFGRNGSPYQSLPLPSRSRSRSEQLSSSGGLVVGHPPPDNPYQSVKHSMVAARHGFDGADPNMVEDEHGLIAQYAQEMHLGGHGNISQNLVSQQSSMIVSNGSSGDLIIENEADGRRAIQNSRQLVYELERKNQEIMHDIDRLRKSHQEQKQQPQYQQKGQSRSPQMLSELQGLRSHRHELESRLDELQGARKDLMDELTELMKLLKVQELHHGRSVPTQSFLRPPAPNYELLHDAERNNSFTNIAGLGIEQAFSVPLHDGCDTQGIAFHDPQQLQAMQYHEQLEQQAIYQQPQESIRPPVIGSNPPEQNNSNTNPDCPPQRSSSQQRHRHRSSSATRKKSSAASRKRSPSANSNAHKNSHQHTPRQSQDNNKQYWQNEGTEIGLGRPHSAQNTISGHS